MLRARLLLLALLVAWLFSPAQWRYAVPLWLPFVLALGLELQFFVGGLMAPVAGRWRPLGGLMATAAGRWRPLNAYSDRLS